MHFIEFSMKHIMSDFSKIRYRARAVIEFLTFENVQPQQICNQMTDVYGNDVPSYAMANH